jgi:SAM-dependent methyltransferase
MDMISYLACPQCHGSLAPAGASLTCGKCTRVYPVSEDVPQFSLAESPSGAGSGERRDYWDQGWQARHASGDHAYLHGLGSAEQWREFIRQQMAAAPKQFYPEASAEFVRDRVMVEIGCGAGISSATFGYLGAHYIGIDHSPTAARHSLAHLRGIGADGFTAQGNAEALPLGDNTMDFVYSNGVLHHTPNFAAAMDEVYRVLKPHGRAVIALYATYSVNLGTIRLQGLLRGKFTRRAMERWMGKASEVAWRTGDKVNLWTETFSIRKLRRFMRRYSVENLKFRKSGSPIGEIPRYGGALMKFGALRHVDNALTPLMGSMVVMTFSKPGIRH